MCGGKISNRNILRHYKEKEHETIESEAATLGIVHCICKSLWIKNILFIGTGQGQKVLGIE